MSDVHHSTFSGVNFFFCSRYLPFSRAWTRHPAPFVSGVPEPWWQLADTALVLAQWQVKAPVLALWLLKAPVVALWPASVSTYQQRPCGTASFGLASLQSPWKAQTAVLGPVYPMPQKGLKNFVVPGHPPWKASASPTSMAIRLPPHWIWRILVILLASWMILSTRYSDLISKFQSGPRHLPFLAQCFGMSGICQFREVFVLS